MTDNTYESTVITDTKGRRITVTPLKPSQQFRLIKTLGNDSSNQAYLSMALLACSVTDIDGTPRPFPSTPAYIEAALDILDDAGFAAIQKHFEAQRPADENALDKVMDSAKN